MAKFFVESLVCLAGIELTVDGLECIAGVRCRLHSMNRHLHDFVGNGIGF